MRRFHLLLLCSLVLPGSMVRAQVAPPKDGSPMVLAAVLPAGSLNAYLKNVFGVTGSMSVGNLRKAGAVGAPPDGSGGGMFSKFPLPAGEAPTPPGYDLLSTLHGKMLRTGKALDIAMDFANQGQQGKAVEILAAALDQGKELMAYGYYPGHQYMATIEAYHLGLETMPKQSPEN